MASGKLLHFASLAHSKHHTSRKDSDPIGISRPIPGITRLNDPGLLDYIPKVLL
jgi:hypothetical protein